MQILFVHAQVRAARAFLARLARRQQAEHSDIELMAPAHCALQILLSASTRRRPLPGVQYPGARVLHVGLGWCRFGDPMANHSGGPESFLWQPQFFFDNGCWPTDNKHDGVF